MATQKPYWSTINPLTQDGVVTLSELQTYVCDAVAKMTEGQQTPWLARVEHLDPNLRLARSGR